MLRLFPVAEAKNGLSLGIVPLGFILKIFPSRLLKVCALDGVAFSPTPT